jgi:hypothetical protein
VTGVTLLVTAWLIPALTRQFQDRQKERELKVTLVSQMSKSVADALVTAQFVASPALDAGGRQREYNRLALEWGKSSAEIESTLEAYFPESDVGERWREYSDVVRSTFYLVTSDVSPRKEEALARVQSYVSPTDTPVDWDLFLPTIDYRSQTALENYYDLNVEVMDEKAELVADVLEANAEGFSTTFADFLRDLVPFVG